MTKSAENDLANLINVINESLRMIKNYEIRKYKHCSTMIVLQCFYGKLIQFNWIY